MRIRHMAEIVQSSFRPRQVTPRRLLPGSWNEQICGFIERSGARQASKRSIESVLNPGRHNGGNYDRERVWVDGSDFQVALACSVNRRLRVPMRVTSPSTPSFPPTTLKPPLKAVRYAA